MSARILDLSRLNTKSFHKACAWLAAHPRQQIRMQLAGTARPLWGNLRDGLIIADDSHVRVTIGTDVPRDAEQDTHAVSAITAQVADDVSWYHGQEPIANEPASIRVLELIAQSVTQEDAYQPTQIEVGMHVVGALGWGCVPLVGPDSRSGVTCWQFGYAVLTAGNVDDRMCIFDHGRIVSETYIAYGLDTDELNIYAALRAGGMSAPMALSASAMFAQV